MKILVVDDASSARMRVKRTLAVFQDLEFEEAANGEDALSLLEFFENAYDLVLLDWHMPRMDGPEVLRQMKEKNIAIPVVMITSEHHKDMVVQALLLGVRSYVVKPYEDAALQHKVEELARSIGKPIVRKAGQPAAGTKEQGGKG